MLISHEYKAIFVAIPHTGSTGIEKMLCEKYGFIKVRSKHSLPVFIPKHLSDYKIIGGIAKPLADIETMYWKFKNDHLGLYSEVINGTGRRHVSLSYRGKKFFQKVNSGAWGFDEFVKKSCFPFFVSKINVARKKYKFIYKKECLNKDWGEICRLLNLEYSSLPSHQNKTVKHSKLVLSENSKCILREQELSFAGKSSGLMSKITFNFWVFIRCQIWTCLELVKVIRCRKYRLML
jgi:hypothetical protein